MAYIVGRNEFLELPENTLYRNVDGLILDDLCVKGDTLAGVNDFWMQLLCQTDTDDIGEMVEMFESKAVRFDLDCQQRACDYLEDQQYLVYDL